MKNQFLFFIKFIFTKNLAKNQFSREKLVLQNKKNFQKINFQTEINNNNNKNITKKI